MVKLCVENYEWKILKTLEGGWKDGWMGGWVDGWMGAKAGLRIAYSNQKVGCSGWVGGWVEVKAGLRIAYSNQ